MGILPSKATCSQASFVRNGNLQGRCSLSFRFADVSDRQATTTASESQRAAAEAARPSGFKYNDIAREQGRYRASPPGYLPYLAGHEPPQATATNHRARIVYDCVMAAKDERVAEISRTLAQSGREPVPDPQFWDGVGIWMVETVEGSREPGTSQFIAARATVWARQLPNSPTRLRQSNHRRRPRCRPRGRSLPHSAANRPAIFSKTEGDLTLTGPSATTWLSWRISAGVKPECGSTEANGRT